MAGDYKGLLMYKVGRLEGGGESCFSSPSLELLN